MTNQSRCGLGPCVRMVYTQDSGFRLTRPVAHNYRKTVSPVLVSLSILLDCLPQRKFRTFYLSPKYPSMKRTMTTAPTSQMMLFMRGAPCLKLCSAGNGNAG